MSKKIFSSRNQESALSEIIGWKAPVFHQASECYVSLSAFDPERGCFRIKKFMLGHIKGKRAQKQYAESLIKRLTEKLLQGWNPWIEASKPLEYEKFDDVCVKYKQHLFKMYKENGLREETLTSYMSRLSMLVKWKKECNVNLFYCYQFNQHLVGEFIDYVFIERNNTLRTRNNYLAWLKTFCKYLMERGYITADPTSAYTLTKAKSQKKEREVIPDYVLQEIRDYLNVHHKHYLLACYILHYLFVRPHEMSLLKVGDFSIKNQTLHLFSSNTKNHNDAVITVPKVILNLMIDLGIFNAPSDYYLFSDDFMPGKERRSEKAFRDYWGKLRKALKFSNTYKFYSLKDTGITNMLKANTDVLTVRDQARHSSILITDIYTPKDIKKANELLLNYQGSL